MARERKTFQTYIDCFLPLTESEMMEEALSLQAEATLSLIPAA